MPDPEEKADPAYGQQVRAHESGESTLFFMKKA
jgi:hypothetical protein